VRSFSWNVSWAVASLVSGHLIVGVGYWLVFVLAAILTAAGTAYYVLTLRVYARSKIPDPTPV
jgi:dipeptide/tripeptide permease